MIKNLLPLWAGLLLISLAGCRESNSRGNPPPSPPTLSPDLVARVHWLGKKKLGLEASAYYFSRILGLPESLKLQSQSLDRLSEAPWRLLKGDDSLANAPVLAIRPLLDDIVEEEGFFESRQASNSPSECAFAIRLSRARSGLWETNLAVAFQSWTGIWPQQRAGRDGWTLRKDHAPDLIELARVGDWTLIGSGQGTNKLLGEMRSRVETFGVPYYFSATNFWIEANVDLKRIAVQTQWKRTDIDDLPRLSVNVTGDGGNVITRGRLDFDHSLALTIEPWTIPTNLIREPLASFTAVRGIRQWLGSWLNRAGIPIEKFPNQLFLWSNDGSATQAYFAAPVSGASNQVNRWAGSLAEKVDGLETRRIQGVSSSGLIWTGLENLSPFLISTQVDGSDYVFGGLTSGYDLATNPPASEAMLHDVVRRTNLVAYDWEVTRSRLISDFYLGQIFRSTARHAQLSVNGVGTLWLNALMPRVGNCATLLTQSAPDQLSFIRKSTVGLSGAELNILIDWLESPRFPFEFHSSIPVAQSPPSKTVQ